MSVKTYILFIILSVFFMCAAAFTKVLNLVCIPNIINTIERPVFFKILLLTWFQKYQHI